MRRMIVCVGLISALCLMSMGQAKEKSGNANTEQVILRLETEGREATLKNDSVATDRLLADNWMLQVSPDLDSR